MATSANPGASRLRSWLLNAGLMFFSLGLTLVVAEVAIRLTGLAKPPADQHSPYPRYYFAADDTMGYDLSPSFPPSDFTLTDYGNAQHGYFKIWTNEIGCYDRPASTAERAILLVGDSFSWGYVPFEDTWASAVERETGSRVLRCGVGGFGPKQARLKSARVIRRLGSPSLVLLGYFIGNDLMDDYLFPQATVNDGYLATKVSLANDATGERRVLTDAEIEANKKAALEPPHGLGIVKTFIADHSIIYNLLRNNPGLRRLAASVGLADPPPATGIPLIFRPAGRRPWLEGAWQEQLDSLRAFAAEVKGKGSQLVVVIIPTREQVYPGRRPPGEAEWDGPDQRVRRFLETEGIPAIDLLEEFRKVVGRSGSTDSSDATSLYWPNDIHLGLAGNRLTGMIVGRYLLQHELVRPADRQARLAHLEEEMGRAFPAR